MSTRLLGTKVHTPPPGRTIVPRQRLLAKLESGLKGKLTLVLAPAGFGKTTLITSWIRKETQPANRPLVARLSLDGDDDEPDRFWSYCILALQTIAPHVGEAAGSMLDLPQPVAAEHFITSLIN